MSQINEQPDPVKLVVNLFYGEELWRERALSEMSVLWGAIDLRMEPVPFGHTTYYSHEMGGGLQKMMVGFEPLVEREALVRLKHEATAIELALAKGRGADGRRPVNIDPGIMLPEKFVLSTGKNFPQRIYLGRGVYADLTLIWRQGRFEALPWTYADYLEGRVLRFLEEARLKLLAQLAERRAEEAAP
ncbi:MAG: DUF4416 family protein [Myxococcales bacterium]|nr:MAG: DUF4416 family protein [Myxococcales bacterium]